MFLKAMWHTVRVLATGLFWLIAVLFVLAGLTQLGMAPLTGQLTLGCVAAVVLLRLILVPKRLKPDVFNVIACCLFAAFTVVMSVTGLTGTAG